MKKTTLFAVLLTVAVVSALIIAGFYAYKQMDGSEKTDNQISNEELIGGQTDEHGCLAPAGYTWCETKQKCLRSWEEFCGIEATENDIESIKQIFMNKYNKQANEVNVYTNLFDGQFARGGVKMAMNGEFAEGGIFLAFKNEGEWTLAFDGNGIYSCEEVTQYNFPDEMIPDCTERSSGELGNDLPINTIDKQEMIKDYIKNNISRLSPEEAVLGGTFYVTEIIFKEENKAVVEYEDGHIAFQAEFTYTFLPDDTIVIDDFTIIEDYKE